MTDADLRSFIVAFAASASRDELEQLHVTCVRLADRRPMRQVRAGLREIVEMTEP